MPLTMAKVGEPNTIKRIGGREETKKFLENLGFVTGGVVTVVSEISGNMILNVKDSRVALGKDMANKIMLMHAMGPNVAGVIGSAIAAGVLISLYG